MARLELKIINYENEYQDSLVVCLGFFDSLHQGHIQLLKKAELVANLKNNHIGVFTFRNNPFEFLKMDSLQVLTFEERCIRLEQYSVDCVLFADFDKEFASLSPAEFVDKLVSNKKISDIVVGNDYTFGKNAEGNVEFLTNYCKSLSIAVHVEDLKLRESGEKFSSRAIRKLIAKGKVDEIAHLLSAPYIIRGQVVKGRQVGKQIGFPTANIELDKSKEKLASGVYLTRTIVDGVALRSITNVGEHPTFEDEKFNVETHILYFNQDIYGKTIVIEFLNKIREIIKFKNIEGLVEQLNKDKKLALSIEY